MSNPTKKIFIVGGLDTPQDATLDFTTDALQVCHEYNWSIEMNESGLTTESGTYTVEVTNDLSLGNWKEYNNNSTNVSVVDGVDDVSLGWTYMRVIYTANGETSGTVNPEITLKNG